MDIRFLHHNKHLGSFAAFQAEDPQLAVLKNHAYAYQPRLLVDLPIEIPGIYTLSGGRQIGKTTLLKLWMVRLLEQGVAAECIAFLTGELIDDHHSLVQLVERQLATMPQAAMQYLLIDEITYIKHWDKGIKYLADAGLLTQVVLLITGSDTTIIQEARMRFPGRRGQADRADFYYYPLSFYETVKLKGNINNLPALLAVDASPSLSDIKLLFSEFSAYLQHGGFLTAINELARQAYIGNATLTTYADWIRGDMLKKEKKSHYLQEIITAIIKRYGSQISWNALSRDLSIDHPSTVADYVQLLASLDAVFIQHAIIEDKLCAAPKKARKIVFNDPFVFHALRAWVWPDSNPYQNQITSALSDPLLSSKLVEACVSTQLRRDYPTYYIKAEGEVDIAYVKDKQFWPIEIKWTQQLRAKDLKQVQKYRNACVWGKTFDRGRINNTPVEPLPLALLRLGASVTIDYP